MVGREKLSNKKNRKFLDRIFWGKKLKKNEFNRDHQKLSEVGGYYVIMLWSSPSGKQGKEIMGAWRYTFPCVCVRRVHPGLAKYRGVALL